MLCLPSRYPVILSIENHCNIQQQKKIAQYLREILGDKLDLGHALSRESKTLPSPNSLQGKILIKVRRGARTVCVMCVVCAWQVYMHV